MADIDELLYSQLNYTLGKNKQSYLTEHMFKLGSLLGKEVVFNAENFKLTVDRHQENITYADLIRNLVGWTARVPQIMINCHLMGDKLYVSQRGKENNIVELTEVLDHSQVAYDDLLDSCYDFLKTYSKNIKDVPSANILGIQNNHLNQFDEDIVKKAVMENGKLFLITDDPFYLTNVNASYSTLSYIIALYVYSFISSKDLKHAVEKLNEMHYSLQVDSNIYNYLLDKSDDPNIHNILKYFE